MADPVLHSPKNPHFFQPLLPGFHSHLNLPVKFFFEHIQGRNEKNTVELKSDACEKTWKVKMEGRRLTGGWKEFAVSHDFRIGDIIIFRHQGDFVFHVTGLGTSCCEIQYLHSSNNEVDSDDDDDQDKENIKSKNITKVRTSMRSNVSDFYQNRKLQRKKRNLEAEDAESFTSDESCFVANVTESNLRVDTLFLPKKIARSNVLNQENNKIAITNGVLRKWTLKLMFRESSGSFYLRHGWRSFCHENGLKPGDSVTFNLECNNIKTPILRFSTSESDKTKDSSKGKKIKETGESSSSQRVSSSLNEYQFVTLTLTPASLKDGRLYLPVSFTRAHNMEKTGGKKITLLDKDGVEWLVNLVMEKRDRSMRLGSGLKEFLKANDIEAYESFVLELVWEDTTTTSSPMLKFCSKIKKT